MLCSCSILFDSFLPRRRRTRWIFFSLGCTWPLTNSTTGIFAMTFERTHPASATSLFPFQSALKSSIWKKGTATIPDKTTWECFPHHVHFLTQQNYFQNDAFAERNPLHPVQCCFLRTPRDQTFEYTTWKKNPDFSSTHGHMCVYGRWRSREVCIWIFDLLASPGCYSPNS